MVAVATPTVRLRNVACMVTIPFETRGDAENAVGVLEHLWAIQPGQARIRLLDVPPSPEPTSPPAPQPMTWRAWLVMVGVVLAGTLGPALIAGWLAGRF